MKVTLEFQEKMHLVGKNKDGYETHFDSKADNGDGNHATPMEILLEAMAACSFMDVVSILRKKRKTIEELKVEVEGERTDTHPKVFKKAHLTYYLKSPDAAIGDLERSVELSQDRYCGASAMFKNSGCEVTWEAHIQ